MSLDAELELIEDPFLRRSMTLAVDGTRSPELRQTMELEMDSGRQGGSDPKGL